jgi:hypothetical protein
MNHDATDDKGNSRPRRAARRERCKPGLTIEDILAWADAHHRHRGEFPTMYSGVVKDGWLGDNWRMIDNALRYGLRGLPGGSSLAKLLTEKRGYRNVRALPPLTADEIAGWAASFHRRHAAWPNEMSGSIPESPGETWVNINAALRTGNRGLPGDDSLAQLLARQFGARTKAAIPNLIVETILAWAGQHHATTGSWPTRNSGPVQGQPGESWVAIDAALIKGGRGLKSRHSLAQLLAKERGVRHKGQLPKLRIKTIVRWAKSHYSHHGGWPTSESGPILDAPGETWKAVNQALHEGLRGLPGGSSLHAVLVRHLGKPQRGGRPRRAS